MGKRQAVFSGSVFEERIGYARAVVDGDWVHVSGTTGFDYATMTVSDDVVEQAEQCLRNVGAALAGAGCTFADVVRVRYLLPERDDFEPCWPVLRRVFGQVRPAATMMVCGLADARMRIELEVYARRGPVAGVRVEAVADGRMLEQWRHVHNAVVPPAALSLDEARDRGARHRLRNAYVGEALVGCSTVRPAARDGEAVTVIARVLPEWRGRGVGRVLYDDGLAHARALGAGEVGTRVLAADRDGLRFAESHGFAEVDRYVLPEGRGEWVDLRLPVVDS
ncbi:GNAT family N-acetyltransferase [Streptomyces cinereospinus]|uniref:GNAT family N-acetyltransferase n=1 Tax=Streptomyces cinereospinus TaxID=285561 RepID=A0ABV5MW14_9ACTN